MTWRRGKLRVGIWRRGNEEEGEAGEKMGIRGMPWPHEFQHH